MANILCFCPSCKDSVSVDESLLGAQASCPSCATMFTLGSSDGRRVPVQKAAEPREVKQTVVVSGGCLGGCANFAIIFIALVIAIPLLVMGGCTGGCLYVGGRVAEGISTARDPLPPIPERLPLATRQAIYRDFFEATDTSAFRAKTRKEYSLTDDEISAIVAAGNHFQWSVNPPSR